MFNFCKKSTFFVVIQIISTFLINSSVLSAVEQKDESFLWSEPDAHRSKSVPPQYKYKDAFSTKEQEVRILPLPRSSSETELYSLLEEFRRKVHKRQTVEYVFVTFPPLGTETMEDLLKQQQQRQKYQRYTRSVTAVIGVAAAVTKFGPLILKGAPGAAFLL